MQVNNKAGLPEPLYQRIKTDILKGGYKKPENVDDVIRVTELKAPPLIRTLWNRHHQTEEFKVDAEDWLTMINLFLHWKR